MSNDSWYENCQIEVMSKCLDFAFLLSVEARIENTSLVVLGAPQCLSELCLCQDFGCHKLLRVQALLAVKAH